MKADVVPRLRVFAGPNGSGKTTLMTTISGIVDLYHVVSPDDLLVSLQRTPRIDLAALRVSTTERAFRRYVANSTYDRHVKRSLDMTGFNGRQLTLSRVTLSPYNVALLSAFLRHLLLNARRSFSYESVLSHPSKITELRHAKALGYRVYLYFVATEDPLINCNRVQQRVATGGHSVPANKIRSRYRLALDNLMPALQQAYRAYLFDNSRKEPVLLAEVTPAGSLVRKTEWVPHWFDAHVLQRLS